MLNLQLLNEITSLKSTDNATQIMVGIFNEENLPMDLRQYENIEVKVATYGSMYLFDEPHSLSEDGTVLTFTMSHGIQSGRYIVEIHLINADGTRHIAPNTGKFVLTIEKSMNEIGDQITTISIEKLLSDMAETLEKADEALLLATNADNKSTTAIQHGNKAIDIANEAKSKAENAVDISNLSNQLVTDANNKSIAATEQSNLAVNQSADALEKANQSIVTSNAAKVDAELAKTQSDTALANSLTAKNDASEALEKANQSISDSSTSLSQSTDALDKASQSLEYSEGALADSQKAKTDASSALQIAQDAKNVADSASSVSSDALEIANQANEKSDTATNTANASNLKADTAISVSNTAIDTSTDALDKATIAKNQSDKAITDSSASLSQSTDALDKAVKAEEDSLNSLSIAQEAKDLIVDAVDVANQFKTVAETAKTASEYATATAEESLEVANQSIADSAQAKTDSSEALKVANEAKVESAAAKLESSKSVTDSANAISIAQTIEAKFNELTTGNTNNEVIDARKTYATLNDRLNAQDTFMTQVNEAFPVYVDDKILALKTETEARLDSIELSMQTAPSYVYSEYEQKFIADGTQSDYVVTVVTVEENDVVYVYQNGIKLTIDDYTLSGNTVTIIPVLNADTEVYVEVLKRELATGSNENEGASNVDLSKYYLKSDVDVLIANLQSQINELKGA